MALNHSSAESGPEDIAGADPLSSAIDAAVNAEPGQPELPFEAKADEKPTAGDERASESPKSPEAKADEKPEEAAPEAKPSLEAPKHWSKEDKEQFAKLPPEGRETLLKLARNLEGGFTRKSQELSDKAKFADAARGLFDEADKALLQRMGVDELGALQHLVQLHRAARENPVGYVKWYMAQTGIDADQLGFSQTAKKTDDTDTKSPVSDDLRDLLSDPEVKQLKAELAQAKEEIGRLTNFRQGFETERQQAAEQARIQQLRTLQGYVGEFRQTLDDNGQLKYPHFDTVAAYMGKLMEFDPRVAHMPDGPEKLGKAYGIAVLAHPDTSEQVLAMKAEERAAALEKQREAERAKRITAIKPARGIPAGTVKPKTLDDIIHGAMSQHGL